MTLAAQLDQALRAHAPIVGVSLGREGDKTTWAIQFAPEATAGQRAAAQAALDGFVVRERTDPGTDLARRVDEEFAGFTSRQRELLKELGRVG